MKVKISGAYWQYYSDFSLTTNLDSVGSTFTLMCYFDPDNTDHQKLFRPCSYHKVQFYHDDDTLFSTGRIVSHSFDSAAESSLVCLSGYSFGGTLEDCQIPYELYPLESNGRSLRQIATRLCDYFGIELHVYQSAAQACDQAIEKSVAEPTETIKNYLSKIASQINVLFSHDIFGGMIFFKPDPKAKSKAFFHSGNSIGINQEINGQALHSTITTVGQPGAGEDGSDDTSQISAVDTITNPLVKIKRPFVDVQSVGKETGTADGAADSLAVELKNIRIAVRLNTWQPNISIGDIVEVQDKRVFLYQKTRFMVAATTLKENTKEKNMEMILVLPETFTGEVPRADLWTPTKNTAL